MTPALNAVYVEAVARFIAAHVAFRRTDVANFRAVQTDYRLARAAVLAIDPSPALFADTLALLGRAATDEAQIASAAIAMGIPVDSVAVMPGV